MYFNAIALSIFLNCAKIKIILLAKTKFFFQKKYWKNSQRYRWLFGYNFKHIKWK